MTDSNTKLANGKNYTFFETGKCAEWPDHNVTLPGLGDIPGKMFLKEALGFTGCEVSVNSLAPHTGMPIYHTHKENEEVYIFIQGQGQVSVDDEVIDVKEGSIVRIAPEGKRVWRNTADEPLVYIIIQVREHSLQQYSLEDADVPNEPVTWSAA
jgi:mannose-6-phosphate isomerase-like protein (cupin superfamily)